MRKVIRQIVVCGGLILSAISIAGAFAEKRDAHNVDKFRQLGQVLPDPNVFRSASGAPGHAYWQQTASYKIVAEFDEVERKITGHESITYTNGSPDSLNFLWLQLDQNRFRKDSLEQRSKNGLKLPEAERNNTPGAGNDRLTFQTMRSHQDLMKSDYGYEIKSVTDSRGTALPYSIVDTMMRIDLPTRLKPKQKVVLNIEWSYQIVFRDAQRARAGYEHFPESDTYIYFLAQWFPRMAAYTDYDSWQHKQFLGRGEFTLEFGDYDVELTVPSDHIVSATGELENAKSVLTATQRNRMAEARSSAKAVYIVTPEEALANEKDKASSTKTWHFKAENVRDFAWASSRKFIWDAAVHEQEGGEFSKVMAMSFFPNEADPLWSQYSTEAVMHTLDVYSRFSFPYPYPTAQSVNTWKAGGMEYPMITFNGYRPKKIKPDERKELGKGTPESTYRRDIKHGLIGVIIHEVGHIYFPMTVNSDERQWTWMDEGINSFLQYLAEQEWQENYHLSRSGSSLLDAIGPYMVSENQVPVMTQSDSILQFGPNAYAKPAAALVVLRETVMGRELFDFAFREYSRRWKFKRPTPSDFFRTMEDASAVDLDWFWRGWFYSTDHVDVGLSSIREYKVASKDPDIDSPAQRAIDERTLLEPIGQKRNRAEGIVPRTQRVEGLFDAYDENDRYTVSNKQRNDYAGYLKGLEPWEKTVLEDAISAGEYIYFVDFVNHGGLLSPLPLDLTFASGDTQRYEVPVEVWRHNQEKVTKMFIFTEQLTAIELDPDHQSADVNRSNNYYPRRIMPSRLELYKHENPNRDLMKELLVELKGDDSTAESDTEMPLEPAS